ncbi:MAG: nitroreductase family deazaflavin-dependent oxidoreductase [Micromonosporaceae bacterium]|nr:nitroreductase family deazaflavin-dependent oxidoreductase [Micromonosporaceae bacterium]
MPDRAYIKPPWWMLAIGNRFSVLNRKMIARLSVPGRRSGRLRTTPVVVLEHEGDRYLIAPFGNTEWVRNLRAARHGRLDQGGRVEQFVPVEISPADRPPLIEAYLKRYGRAPKVASSFRQLPDPADHPTFRINAVA